MGLGCEVDRLVTLKFYRPVGHKKIFNDFKDLQILLTDRSVGRDQSPNFRILIKTSFFELARRRGRQDLLAGRAPGKILDTQEKILLRVFGAAGGGGLPEKMTKTR